MASLQTRHVAAMLKTDEGVERIAAALSSWARADAARASRNDKILARLGEGWSVDGDDLVHSRTGRYVGAAKSGGVVT